MPKKAKHDEIACPECKEPVSWNARRCPHCQAVYSQEVIDSREKEHKNSNKIAIGCLGVVVLFVLGMCAMPSSDDNEAAEASPNAAVTATSSEATPIQLKAAVQEFNDAIMSASRPCDNAGEALANASDGLTKGSTSMYDAYTLAAGVENSCRESWERVTRVTIPAVFEGEALTAAKEAHEMCGNAMVAKQMGGEAMKEVFDGDLKPSSVETARQKVDTAQAGLLACVAGIYDTATKAKVDFSELDQSDE